MRRSKIHDDHRESEYMKFIEFTEDGTRFKIQQFPSSLREQPDRQVADVLSSALNALGRSSLSGVTHKFDTRSWQ
jgi:hypothetical protein